MENVPAAHQKQDADSVTCRAVEKVPARHKVQDAMDVAWTAVENVPAGHGVHCPPELAYVPAIQPRQMDDPCIVFNTEFKHRVQVLLVDAAIAVLKVPAGQRVQIETANPVPV